MTDTLFFGVPIAEKSCHRFGYIVTDRMEPMEKAIQRTHSHLDGFDTDELAVVAKDDENAIAELFRREDSYIQLKVDIFLRDKTYLSKDEVYDRLYSAVLKAVQIYDPKISKFSYLLSKMFDITLTDQYKKEAIEHYRISESLGKRIQNAFGYDYVFEDSFVSPASEEEIIFRIDFDEFLKTLSDDRKEILLLYSEGRSFREIGDLLNKPASTVSYQIYVMLSKLGINRKK